MQRRGPEPDLPGYAGDDEPEPAPRPTLVDWGLFAVRATWRRKALAAAVFVLGIGAAVAYYRLRTPTYRVETIILAQRQQALPSIVRSTLPDDAPTRSAWELVHKRENLLALIKQTNLLAESGTALSKGWLLDRLQLPALGLSPADKDPLNELALRLDRALIVTTSEWTVTIAIHWPDPQQAYQLVEAAVQNFLEVRHLHEITAIDELISILDGRAATLRDELERAIEEAQRDAVKNDESSRRLPRREAAERGEGSRRMARHPVQPSEELVRLKSILDAKERAIADVEEFRRRRLADLQAQLDEKRSVYSDAHPSIVSLRQEIVALSRESPQAAALREEERKLRRDYAARLAQEIRPQGPPVASPAASRAAPQQANAPAEQNERVREARLQYQQMVERVNAAQLDMEAARAAFKYRYNVVWPAQLPKSPVSPNPVKVFGLGALASLLLAALAAVAPDLRSGRIVERWQIEHVLDLPILGELNRK